MNKKDWTRDIEPCIPQSINQSINQSDDLSNLKGNGNLSNGQKNFLDLVRIIAAYFVLLGHSFSFYKFTFLKDETYFPFIQNIGVVLFFLLAGFLTTMSLEKKNRNHDYEFKNYVKYKTLRFMKELGIGLIFISIIDYISIYINGEKYAYSSAFDVKTFFGNIFMLQDTTLGSIPYFKITSFGSGRPLWTLSIEYWFYLIFSFLYLSISNRIKINIPKIVLFSFLLIIPLKNIISGRGGGLGFVFLLGVLIYYSYNLIENKTAKYLFPLSCIVYIIQGLIIRNAYTVISFINLTFILALGLKLFSNNITTNRNNILLFISKTTFLLYLTHYSIIDLIFNCNFSCNNYLKFVLGIFISISLSIGLYKLLIEKNKKNLT